jgi:hypothetical protein
MSMIRTRTRRIKATRHTARSAAPFGAGLFRFNPYAVFAPGFVEPRDEARDAAATSADSGPEPDWDFLAAESAGFDAVTAGCYV